jgi:predicted RNA binding protein YcfA (HicA-like mRNA interferase family)
MSKAEKLAAKILSGKSDQNFSFADLCHVIERAGFQLRSGKGSHRIYYKDGVVEIINVQPRGGGPGKTVSSKTGARTAFKV